MGIIKESIKGFQLVGLVEELGKTLAGMAQQELLLHLSTSLIEPFIAQLVGVQLSGNDGFDQH